MTTVTRRAVVGLALALLVMAGVIQTAAAAEASSPAALPRLVVAALAAPADGPCGAGPCTQAPGDQGPCGADPCGQLPPNQGPCGPNPCPQPPANQGPCGASPCGQPPADEGPCGANPCAQPPANEGPCGANPCGPAAQRPSDHQSSSSTSVNPEGTDTGSAGAPAADGGQGAPSSVSRQRAMPAAEPAGAVSWGVLVVGVIVAAVGTLVLGRWMWRRRREGAVSPP
jgi:uncharacterized low-complexity protein